MGKQEEIKKAIDKVVDEVLGSEEETKTEEVEKAMPTSMPENGGQDKIKSGQPFTDKKDLKAKEAKKSNEEEEDEDEEKTKEKDESNVEKAKDYEKERGRQPQEEGDIEEKHEKLSKKKKGYVKKSIEELSEVLDEDELALIKAWRSEGEVEEEDEKTDSETKEEDVTKSFNKTLDEKFDKITKAFEEKLGEKDELIKSMSDKIEKMASQPAYDKRSVENLEPIEKSEDATPTISKGQILDTMLNMQLSGKNINSRHIAEMEATGNISDPQVKQMVMKEIKGSK